MERRINRERGGINDRERGVNRERGNKRSSKSTITAFI